MRRSCGYMASKRDAKATSSPAWAFWIRSVKLGGLSIAITACAAIRGLLNTHMLAPRLSLVAHRDSPGARGTISLILGGYCSAIKEDTAQPSVVAEDVLNWTVIRAALRILRLIVYNSPRQ